MNSGDKLYFFLDREDGEMHCCNEEEWNELYDDVDYKSEIESQIKCQVIKVEDEVSWEIK